MKIVEAFYSIQSEGYHAGRAAFFIRLYGCNLQCDFGNGYKCDEPLHTQKESVRTLTEKEVINMIPVECDFVVITGGEPSLYDLNQFISELQNTGHYVAVETNGYNISNIQVADWITYSPKHMFGSPDMKPNVYDEVKVLAGVNNPIPADCYFSSRLYVQPIAMGNEPDPFNTSYCVDFVKTHPQWRLSIQTHKYIGVR